MIVNLLSFAEVGASEMTPVTLHVNGVDIPQTALPITRTEVVKETIDGVSISERTYKFSSLPPPEKDVIYVVNPGHLFYLGGTRPDCVTVWEKPDLITEKMTATKFVRFVFE